VTRFKKGHKESPIVSVTDATCARPGEAHCTCGPGATNAVGVLLWRYVRRKLWRHLHLDSMSESMDSADFATGREVSCPYCGARVSITLDPTGGTGQDYVEDCHVCCRPWRVRVRFDSNGSPDVTVTTEDDS
jgi:Cysteine-rich CPXCG